MSVTPEQARAYLEGSDLVVQTHPDVLGYLPIGDHSVLFVVTEPADEKEREAIIKSVPDFQNVFFLAGVDPDSYHQDPSLVQRVVGYSGMLPGWRISIGIGQWQDNQNNLDPAPNIANISVIPFRELAAKL